MLINKPRDTRGRRQNILPMAMSKTEWTNQSSLQLPRLARILVSHSLFSEARCDLLDLPTLAKRLFNFPWRSAPLGGDTGLISMLVDRVVDK